MPTLALILLVLAAGALTAIQAPTNAFLARALGSPFNAALLSFAVGLAALVAMVLQQGVRPDLAAMRLLPWWAWIGGLYGVVFVTTAIIGAPRLGVALFLILSVTGQLVVAAIIDATGGFGLTPRPITVDRVAGILLVIAGVALVARNR